MFFVDQLEGAYVFQAGTKLESRTEKVERGKQVVTAGGRVLGVTALGDGIKLAIDKAYRAVDYISFKNMHYRQDIGKKALKYL